MKRIRVAGLIEMEGGYALMHRMNVKPDATNPNKPHGEYYVFPGGGLEEDDASFEEGVAREVLEEFGIEVEVKEQIASFEEMYKKLFGKEPSKATQIEIKEVKLDE